ncbi:hypothetical protein C6558_15235 [Ensifer sp. NM-2]|nr:hypothetical protein C6558_15235 [Ensifer sp. NM-2]
MYRSDPFLAAALDFIDRQNSTQKPWFCYFNSIRMHGNTHLKPLANFVQAMMLAFGSNPLTSGFLSISRASAWAW